MNNFFYTAERGQQIVIALLKAHGIRKVIASPGTTNITLVASMQQDPWFEMYSSVDERSAAYMACGMAEESGEPVVLSCTGATASRNYMPGLTEAYYRKLPIIAITATQGNGKLGQLIAQNIDRRVLPNDIALCSIYVPIIQNEQEERMCEVNVNRAILETKHRGGGPVHINLQTGYSLDFSVKKLPPVRIINRITCKDEFPDIPQGGVAVYVGCHSFMPSKLVDAIDRFCATYNAIVLCDHASGYYGRYRVMYNLISSQTQYVSKMNKKLETIVHIGEIMGSKVNPFVKDVWRVSEDGELRNTFGKLRYVFEMSEIMFFNHYAKDGCSEDSYLKECQAEYNKIYEAIPELPFSNIWMAQQLSQNIPSDCVLHLGIFNSFRSWNFFEIPKGIRTYCNVGGFGIDGNMSTMIGASLASSDKLFFGIFGDLAFFYDMNSLGNRHRGNNIRILIVNNGLGAEMTLGGFNILGEDLKPYIVAAGHYGNKSPMLVRHYAEDLGFKYLTASNKEEFRAVMERFLTPQKTDKPILFETFIRHEDESEALRLMRHIETDFMNVVQKKSKELIKSVVGENKINVLKKVIGK